MEGLPFYSWYDLTKTANICHPVFFKLLILCLEPFHHDALENLFAFLFQEMNAVRGWLIME